MRISKPLSSISMKTNPELFGPFWQMLGQMWKITGLEKTVLELVRIKSATIAGCRR